MSVVRKILRTKIQVSNKLKKTDQCFYQIQGSLKIKNSSTTLKVFDTTSLK